MILSHVLGPICRQSQCGSVDYEPETPEPLIGQSGPPKSKYGRTGPPLQASRRAKTSQNRKGSLWEQCFLNHTPRPLPPIHDTPTHSVLSGSRSIIRWAEGRMYHHPHQRRGSQGFGPGKSRCCPWPPDHPQWRFQSRSEFEASYSLQTCPRCLANTWT